MSLNDIELPDSLVTELYGDKLLISAQRATPPPPQPAATSQPVPPVIPAATTAQTKAASQSAPTAVAPSAYKFLGNNLKKITILVDSPQTAFLPDEQLAFLTKMLEACKLNIGDVAIVNQANSPVEIASLKRQLSPVFLLLFGPGPEAIGLPIHFPLFKIQPYDQCSYLSIPSLAQLVQPGDESKLLKSKLWVCLRQLFEV
jgi:hypothetical protein